MAVAYTVAQLLVTPPHSYLGPDESLYYGQASPSVPGGYMGAPRAWGVPILALPAAMLNGSMLALRLYLSTLSGLGVFLAFLTWLKVHPSFSVPLAALLFCSLWPSLFYGSELMPNLPSALCAVAAVGLFLQAARASRAWGPMAGIAVAFASMSLIRPTEALPVAGTLTLAALLWKPWRRPAPLGAIAVGLAVGWIPWTIEAYLRFGGLTARLGQNSLINDVGWHFAVVRHLEAFGTSTLLCDSGMPNCGEVTLPATLVWLAIPFLTGLGVWAVRGTAHLSQAVLAVSVGIAAAAPYLFYSELANPRFLLGAYAMLALVAAEGIRWMATRHRATRLVAFAVIALFSIEQFSTAQADGHNAGWGRTQYVRIAHRLTVMGIRRPCLIYGYGNWQVAVAAGCDSFGDRLLRRVNPGSEQTRQFLSGKARAGVHVVVLSTSAADRHAPPGWTRYQIMQCPGLYAYLSTPGSEPPPAHE
ncbi:hypothetical protein J4573_34150 [Actinomadura barringtoniae]|uniref:Uncharacterized protein n=1 Tax=Actinomadura barringtoniae TaxID=1427535 RepID=A0A939PLN6_9ACTN|nr:hypothetical protein [Actinomadura barringtoniae]MBO2452174.1 hypothetical protein [Actinomadura barringtoniae]